VPGGLGSITDRAMPHLFPTANRDTFAATLRRAMGIERPPPSDGFSVLITTLGSLSRLASDNFFAPSATRRLMVVFTDGETKPFVDRSLATLFQRPPGVKTIFVRVWKSDEHVYANGAPDPLYHPDRRGGAYLRALASATGGNAYDEDAYRQIVETARRDLGQGPTSVLARQQKRLALAPWIAALTFLPLGFLLWRRNL
jgi:hypothetical protein